jgi:hypothetical protein
MTGTQEEGNAKAQRRKDAKGREEMDMGQGLGGGKRDGVRERERGGKEKQYYGILFSFALFWFVFLSPIFSLSLFLSLFLLFLFLFLVLVLVLVFLCDFAPLRLCVPFFNPSLLSLCVCVRV